MPNELFVSVFVPSCVIMNFRSDFAEMGKSVSLHLIGTRQDFDIKMHLLNL